jgi:hypothetical protein
MLDVPPCCAMLWCAAAGSLAWKALMRDFWGPLEHSMTAAQGVGVSEVRQAVPSARTQHSGQCVLLVV